LWAKTSAAVTTDNSDSMLVVTVVTPPDGRSARNSLG
jgi:hypothetical protein